MTANLTVGGMQTLNVRLKPACTQQAAAPQAQSGQFASLSRASLPRGQTRAAPASKWRPAHAWEPLPAQCAGTKGPPTWVKAELCCLPNGGQHALVALPPRHRHKAVGLQRVQADVEQGEACSAEGAGWTA